MMEVALTDNMIFRISPVAGELYLIDMMKLHGINKVFDVGANTGQYAEMLFDRGYRGKVVSFEPLMYDYTMLSQKQNDRWTVSDRCAIGDENKEVVINVSNYSPASSLLPMLRSHMDMYPATNTFPGVQYVGIEKVNMFTLDTIGFKYIAPDDRVLLKIDAQGYESRILKGSREFLKHVEGIYMECFLVPLYEGTTLLCEDIKNVENLGFELYDIQPESRDDRNKKLLAVNCIFFKKDSGGN